MTFSFACCRLMFLLSVCCASRSAFAITQSDIRFQGRPFRVLKVDLRSDALTIVFKHPDGHQIVTLPRLRASAGDKFLAGTNAGIVEPDGTPTGLLKAGGTVIKELNLRDGGGNFYLKPNGVFFLTQSGPKIEESRAFARDYGGGLHEILAATQSGPLLVVNGTINSRLLPDSKTQLYSRSAVAVLSPNDVAIVLALDQTNLYQLAVFLRDSLHAMDALYLDGVISQLDTGDAKIRDPHQKYAGFLAVTKR